MISIRQKLLLGFGGLLLIVAAIMLNGVVASVIDSRRGRKINSIRLYGEMLKHRLILILNTLAIFYWLSIFLNAFHIRSLAYKLIVSVLTNLTASQITNIYIRGRR